MLGVAAVSLAVVTRYLGPERYGEYALAIAFVSLFGVLADVGLFAIVVREISRRPPETERLVGNVLVLRGLLAVVCVALAAAISLLLPYTPSTRWAIVIYGLPFVLGMLNSGLTAVFQSRLRMDRAAIADVVGRATALAALGVVVLADLGFYAVVAVAGVGALASLALSAALVRPLARVRPRAEPAVWRSLLAAALPLGLSFAVTEIYFRADTFIISLLRPVEDVGLYGFAYRIFELLAIFSSIVMASVFPILSGAVASDAARTRRVLQGTSDLLVVVGVPLAVGGAILAPGIVDLVGGPEFAEAAEPMRLLLVAGGLAYVNGLLGYALIARDRQRDLLRINVSALVVNVGLNFALVGAYGITAAAAVMIACEIAILFASIVLMRRHYAFVPSFAILGRALPAAAVMAAVTWPLRDAPVLAVTVLGALVYGGVLFAVGGVDREMLRRLRAP